MGRAMAGKLGGKGQGPGQGPGDLSQEDRDLWRHVTRDARPLKKRAPAPRAAPEPKAEATDQVSLTGAFAGVAETGTLLLVSGPQAPTTLNFLPLCSFPQSVSLAHPDP